MNNDDYDGMILNISFPNKTTPSNNELSTINEITSNTKTNIAPVINWKLNGKKFNKSDSNPTLSKKLQIIKNNSKNKKTVRFSNIVGTLKDELTQEQISEKKANDNLFKENKDLIKNFDIFPTNDNETKKMSSWNINSILASHLENKFEIIKPTIIQKKVIQQLDSNITQNILIKARTGSGKTLGYLLPIVDKLLNASAINGEYINQCDLIDRSIGILALIIVPSRELASQVYQVLLKLLQYPVNSTNKSTNKPKYYHWITPGLLIGGEKRSSEKAKLRKGVNILVATPGRLLDHFKNTKSASFANLKWLIIDEIDRILELGHEESLNEIYDMIKKSESSYQLTPNHSSSGHFKTFCKQLSFDLNVLFSTATLTNFLKAYCKKILKNFEIITDQEDLNDPKHEKINDIVDNDEEYDDSKELSNSLPTHLKHSYISIPVKLRLVGLLGIILFYINEIADSPKKLLIFVSNMKSADYLLALFKTLNKLDNNKEFIDKIKFFSLHGSHTQSQRSHTINSFNNETNNSVIFCTDVASRGIDLKINYVVHYDPPSSLKDYVHRSGRTARMQNEGESLIFLLNNELPYLAHLNTIQIFPKELFVDKIFKVINNTISKDQEKLNWRDKVARIQNHFEKQVAFNLEIKKLARQAYSAHMKSYTTHSGLQRQIFKLKAMHLGHLATAFALTESPRQIQKFLKDDDADNNIEDSELKNQYKNNYRPSNKRALFDDSDNNSRRTPNKDYNTDFDHNFEFNTNSKKSALAPKRIVDEFGTGNLLFSFQPS